MVLPDHIEEPARDGNIAVVEEWLDGAGLGAVNEVDNYGQTLLLLSVNGSIGSKHVQFARRMIARGADVNLRDPDTGNTALKFACYPGGSASSMVSLLLQAGARVNYSQWGENITPLGTLLTEFDFYVGFSFLSDNPQTLGQVSCSGLEIMELLLRNGASLDRCREDLSAEELMQAFLTNSPHYADDEYFTKCRELVAGVRAHGSWKATCLAPLKDFLRLRSLLVRGRAKTDSRRLERLARLPNGACWHVLSFWRDAA